MSCLHTISQSPKQELLQTCATVLQAGDAVLFLEDGVYHCMHYADWPPLDRAVHVYGLHADMQARGVLSRSPKTIEVVDYNGFVALCAEYDKVVSWF
jgi:tRNA 2-thiouridine synthesizing protein B